MWMQLQQFADSKMFAMTPQWDLISQERVVDERRFPVLSRVLLRQEPVLELYIPYPGRGGR